MVNKRNLSDDEHVIVARPHDGSRRRSLPSFALPVGQMNLEKSVRMVSMQMSHARMQMTVEIDETVAHRLGNIARITECQRIMPEVDARRGVARCGGQLSDEFRFVLEQRTDDDDGRGHKRTNRWLTEVR
jgi:hypothetical protein